MSYDIYISYRDQGDGLFVAYHLYDVLVRDGYTVSFDKENFKGGESRNQMFQRIDECTDFLVIIDEHAFDKIINPPRDYNPGEDWFRLEIAHALESEEPKKIVPICLPDVRFPSTRDMPKDLKNLEDKSCLNYPKQHFNSFYEELTACLETKPGVKIVTKTREHFPRSMEIVQDKMIPKMNEKARQANSINENKEIDSYIQSPIEYANEIVLGNQVPKFDPNALYQDVLFDKSIKYIVAITAETPNMFLDPTIGFYISNCYAISLMRHTNDYIRKNYKSNPNKIPVISVKNHNKLDDEIIEKKINTCLKNGKMPTAFEFIRIFIYDESHGKGLEKTILPSLKASQDLFRTPSFYLRKKKLDEVLEKGIKEKNDKKKYTIKHFRNCNKELWGYFHDKCQDNTKALEVLQERINKNIPEFLFVFYKKKAVIHTYLGGEHFEVEAEMQSDKEKKIKELLKILAVFMSEDKENRQLSMSGLRNKLNAVINIEFVDPLSRHQTIK